METEIVSYIRQEKGKGTSCEAIVNQLMTSGWTKEAVAKGLVAVYGFVPAVGVFRLPDIDSLLHRAIALYRANWKLLITLSFLQYAAVYLISLAVSASQFILPVLVQLLLRLALIVLQFLVQTGLIAALIAAVTTLGTAQSVRSALAKGRLMLLRFLGLSVLEILLVVAGVLLFIIPGLIMIILFMSSHFILFVENIGGWAAIKRSYRYVKRYWWQVATRLIAVNILIFLVGFIVSYIATHSALAPLNGLLSALINTATTPFTIIYGFLLYQSLRELDRLKSA